MLDQRHHSGSLPSFSIVPRALPAALSTPFPALDLPPCLRGRPGSTLGAYTGKRVMRSRPQEEWITVDAPELRIIPPKLWEAVQKRSDERGLRHGAIWWAKIPVLGVAEVRRVRL